METLMGRYTQGLSHLNHSGLEIPSPVDYKTQGSIGEEMEKIQPQY